MPYNLLILPLIAGYIWLSRSPTYEAPLRRANRTQYLLHVALLGLVLLLVSRSITFAAEQWHTEAGYWLLSTWREFAALQAWSSPGGIDDDQSHTAALTIALAFLAPRLEIAFNTYLLPMATREGSGANGGTSIYQGKDFFTRTEIYKIVQRRRDIMEKGSELEMLFLASVERITRLSDDSITEAEREDPAVLITLKNRKCYVGYVEDPPRQTLEGEQYVGILPTDSGYRDSETLSLRLTTDYSDAWELAERFATEEQRNEQLRIYLPVSEIASASFFNRSLHEDLQGAGIPRDARLRRPVGRRNPLQAG